jgi:hypothetical protein
VNNDDDDMPVTILNQIADALERHNEILAGHRKCIEQLIQENQELKKRLTSLEAPNPLDSSDGEFLADIATRLKGISKTLDVKL